MLAEQQTTYLFRDELLCAYLHLMLHEALRLHQPPRSSFRYYCRLPGPAGGLAPGWGRRGR